MVVLCRCERRSNFMCVNSGVRSEIVGHSLSAQADGVPHRGAETVRRKHKSVSSSASGHEDIHVSPYTFPYNILYFQPAHPTRSSLLSFFSKPQVTEMEHHAELFRPLPSTTTIPAGPPADLPWDRLPNKHEYALHLAARENRRVLALRPECVYRWNPLPGDADTADVRRCRLRLGLGDVGMSSVSGVKAAIFGSVPPKSTSSRARTGKANGDVPQPS